MTANTSPIFSGSGSIQWSTTALTLNEGAPSTTFTATTGSPGTSMNISAVLTGIVSVGQTLSFSGVSGTPTITSFGTFNGTSGTVNLSSSQTWTNPTTVTATGGGAYIGTDANDLLVATAGSNGSFIQRLRFKAKGTNVVTVARIYINNGSTHTTAANNTFYGEVTLPATTVSASSATVDLDYPMNLVLPASYTLYVGLGTLVAAGWNVQTIGGNY